MKKLILIMTLTAGLLVQPTQCFNFNWNDWKKATIGTLAAAVCVGLWGYYKGWFTKTTTTKKGKISNSKIKKNNLKNEEFDDVLIFTKTNTQDDNSFEFLFNTKSTENRYAKKSDFKNILDQINPIEEDKKTISFPPNSSDPNDRRTIKVMYIQPDEKKNIKIGNFNWIVYNKVGDEDMLLYQFINQSVGPGGLNNLIKKGQIEE